MAEPNQEPTPELNQKSLQKTLLIAHVTAHLLDNTSFELYPFVDEKDVKAKVFELISGWASSGFLLRGAHFVPWHRVSYLETTSVEEITRQEAQQRLMDWQADDQLKAVQNFWKMKDDKNDKGEKKDGEEENGE